MEKSENRPKAAVRPQDDPLNIKQMSAYLVILGKLREVASRRRAVLAKVQIRQNGFQNESPTRRRQRIARVVLGFPERGGLGSAAADHPRTRVSRCPGRPMRERGVHGMYAFAGVSMTTCRRFRWRTARENRGEGCLGRHGSITTVTRRLSLT